jgi:hypothetical protein
MSSQAGPLSIRSEALEVWLNPRVGGTITAITHRESGLDVLGNVPWDAVDAPIGSLAARDEAHWLTRYTGGWPLLFPNGGDACTVDGTFHGFHGEASIAPWTAVASEDRVRLTRRFFSVPVEMEREIRIDDDLLIVTERVRSTGQAPIDVMWGHHPTFGSDLLAGEVEITSGARRVTVDDSYDPSANPLLPGATGNWPNVDGKAGSMDLSRPAGPLAAVAYLLDFTQPWAAIRRLDNSIAAALSWDGSRFPCAWLWYELGGTLEAPWYGRGRVIGIEPNTTMPGTGLASARLRNSHLQRLEPGEALGAELRLHVFRPTGPVTAIDPSGRRKLP